MLYAEEIRISKLILQEIVGDWSEYSRDMKYVVLLKAINQVEYGKAPRAV